MEAHVAPPRNPAMSRSQPLQQPIQKWLGEIDENPAAAASISARDQAMLREGVVMPLPLLRHPRIVESDVTVLEVVDHRIQEDGNFKRTLAAARGISTQNDFAQWFQERYVELFCHEHTRRNRNRCRRPLQ
jgi:hypothetical protein